MSVNDQGSDNVDFYIKEEGDIITELLLLAGGGEDFVLMSFIGKIDIDKLAELSKSIDIGGMEHLDKMKKKKKAE